MTSVSEVPEPPLCCVLLGKPVTEASLDSRAGELEPVSYRRSSV